MKDIYYGSKFMYIFKDIVAGRRLTYNACWYHTPSIALVFPASVGTATYCTACRR